MKFKFDFKRIFGGAADALFAIGLKDANTFHGAVRPILNGHAGGDILKAQTLAMQGLAEHLHVLQKNSHLFLEQLNDDLTLENVTVTVCGKKTTPIGTAAGLDLDAEGLKAFGLLFGFQVPGPVTVQSTQLDAAPFQEDTRRSDLYVPPRIGSRGLVHVANNIRAYRDAGGTAILLPAIVGSTSDGSSNTTAMRDLQTLLETLSPLSDGFVWAPTFAESPQISEDHFQQAGKLMANMAPEKLKLVAMPAYEPEQQTRWLALSDAFLGGGGDGLVAVVGREVSRDEVPRPEEWPFQTALHVGGSLAAYRQRAIEDARRQFPQAFIAACGGFHSRNDAFRACEYANVIMENEAFTRFGPAIARSLLNKLVLRLNYLQREGLIESASLIDYQQSQWS